MSVRVRKEVHSDVAAVTNGIHDNFLTEMDGAVMSRVEMVVRSIAGSLSYGPKSVVQNQDQRDLSRKLDDTLVTTTSNCRDLGLNQNDNDETRSSENLEDGKIPVLKSNFDREMHIYHMTRTVSTFVIDSFCHTVIFQVFTFKDLVCNECVFVGQTCFLGSTKADLIGNITVSRIIFFSNRIKSD